MLHEPFEFPESNGIEDGVAFEEFCLMNIWVLPGSLDMKYKDHDPR